MDTEQEPNAPDDEQSVEEFKDEVENDPSTAKPTETEDTDLDRLRGG